MKECFDEARLQAYFDGELSPELMERVGRHLSTCVMCAGAVHQAERENAVVLSALEPEMSQEVPTEQLRARINAAIDVPPALAVARTSSNVFGRSAFQFLSNLFRLEPKHAVAFATILAIVILGSIFARIQFRNATIPMVPVQDVAIVKVPKDVAPSVNSDESTASSIKITKGKRSRWHGSRTGTVPAKDQIVGVKLMPGEEDYLKTIAALDLDLKQKGAESMTPTMRSEYERNLKLCDYAIGASRSTAKRNPNDPQAAEFLYAAYQSKIDMMNNIAEQVQWARR